VAQTCRRWAGLPSGAAESLSFGVKNLNLFVPAPPVILFILFLTRPRCGGSVRRNEVAPVAKRFTTYFIVFLCLGVMNRELPECMALQDDVSNDGDVAVYSLQLTQAVARCSGTLDQEIASPSGNGSSPWLFLDGRSSRMPSEAAHAGVDLLRLIDQQRC